MTPEDLDRLDELVEEVKLDETTSTLTEKDEVNEIITALENIIDEVKDVEPQIIKQVVNEFLSEEDINEMKSVYHSCFDEIPNNNPLKLYVLHLFNILQIPIMYEIVEEDIV